MPRVRCFYAVESVVRFPRDIEHPSIGQLTVVLTSPLGTSVTLHNRTGSITDDIIGNYDENLPVDGPGSLGDFLGQPVQGDWTLTVADHQFGALGIFHSWGTDGSARFTVSKPPRYSISPA